MKLWSKRDLSKISYFADDFKEMYELLDHDEPEFWMKNIVYVVQQDYTDANPRQLTITATDIYNVPDDASYYNEKYAYEKKVFPNSFELAHKYKLITGKTIAETVCEHMGLDPKTTMPIYPDWLSPLGEIKPVEKITDEEYEEIIKHCDEITDYLWQKDIEEMKKDGDIEGLKMYAEAEREVENMKYDERAKKNKKQQDLQDDDAE